MNNLPIKYQSNVISLTACSSSCYRLVIERCGMDFETGREIMLHGAEPFEDRQYSIASGEKDENLEILFRLIPGGVLTPKLVQLEPGDPIAFTGPFGSFLIRDTSKPLVFIATGTGIAPALSFIATHPNLDMTIYHGVRQAEDMIAAEPFGQDRYIPCISQQPNASHFNGRVTAKLEKTELDLAADYYLCGANEMILDVHRSLKERGVPEEHIYSEAYYFW